VLSVYILSRAKDSLIKSAVEKYLTKITGAKVTIEKFFFGIPLRSIRIEGFKMYNPQGFSPSILIDLPKVAIEFDLIPLISYKLHLPHVDIELKELVLERNKEGKLNVDSLKIAQKNPDDSSESDHQLAFRIDLLNLQIGKIIEKNYHGKKIFIKAYDMNLKRSYRNISSANQLILLILTEPMKQIGIKSAEIYGISTFAGVVALPIAVALKVIGSDSVQQDIEMDINDLYDLTLKVLDDMGEIKKQSKTTYTISSNIHGADVAVKLRWISENNSQLTVSARKYFFPHHEIASGVLYELMEELNTVKR
jgi:uncharacterized protein involved in outer membrane biogenesis